MTASRGVLAGVVLGCVAAGTVLTLTCDRPVVREGVPDTPESGPPPGPDDRAAETVLRRILAKDRIVDALAEDRLPLVPAAALFRELDRVSPPTVYVSVTPPNHPLPLTAPTEAEWYCGVVVLYTRNSLAVTRPDRADGVTERLVAEFRAEKRRHGSIRLPGPEDLEHVRRSLGFAPDDWPASAR